MNALSLYKFITQNNSEYHWLFDSDGCPDVLLFVDFSEIESFAKLLQNSRFLINDGLNAVMKNKYFVFQMAKICEHFNIELSEVFETTDNRLR
jgi:hypothetical protein